MDKEYQLTIRLKFDAFDDPAARDLALSLLHEMYPVIRDASVVARVVEKLQEVKEGEPPRHVSL